SKRVCANHLFVLLLLALVSSCPLGKAIQAQTLVAGQNVPSGRALFLRTLAAMDRTGQSTKSANYVIEGTIQVGSSDSQERVRILSRGASDLLFEITSQDGTIRSSSILRGKGHTIDAHGRRREIKSSASRGTEIPLLPSGELLADLEKSAT